MDSHSRETKVSFLRDTLLENDPLWRGGGAIPLPLPHAEGDERRVAAAAGQRHDASIDEFGTQVGIAALSEGQIRDPRAAAAVSACAKAAMEAEKILNERKASTAVVGGADAAKVGADSDAG